MRGFKNPVCGIFGSCVLNYRLLRVKLDHQVFVNRGGEISPRRHGLERAFEALGVDLQPFREAASLRGFGRGLDAQLVLGLGRDFDHVAWLQAVGRNVHTLAVHQDRVVAHDLARLATRGAEAHAIGDVVETRLEQLQQALAGHALGARGVRVRVAELSLEQPVRVAHLLLLTQLLAVIGHARAALLPVLAGRVRTALDGAFVGEALLALEIELFAFAAAMTALVEVSGHVYTLRRFGGRHPLCGIGVTSAIEPIFRPMAFSARTADSRPGPGPLMRTSMFFTPHSCAARPQRSAATCAASGVDLREPLKPALPEVAQASVLPWRSVIVTMVLLNDAWICAIPSATFFLTFLRARAAAVCCSSWRVGALLVPMSYAAFPVGTLSLIAALRGPLRVRALVRVRWPRTGSPLRWREPR